MQRTSVIWFLAFGIALLWPRSGIAEDERNSGVLLEAERFATDGGWTAQRAIDAAYFVDSIGAGHYSGGKLLQLLAGKGPSSASIETSIPRDGRYRIWARYDYPWRGLDASFQVRIQQHGQTVFESTYGAPDSPRMWFFNLPDAAWNDQQHGVEGPVSEMHDADLGAGAATVSLIGQTQYPSDVNRNVDFLFITSDVTDSFRQRGEKLYPILDEIGRSVNDRLYGRITNHSAVPLTLEAQYTFNRAPWRSPAIQIGLPGGARGGRPTPIPPGEESPWVNLSCQDTTHPCHLQLRPGVEQASVTLELASAPTEAAVLRRLDLDQMSSATVVNVPPYPADNPEGITTGEEAVQHLLDYLEGSNPPGWPPQRMLIYGSLGDNVERRLNLPDAMMSGYRELFQTLGLNAFNNLNLSALPAELEVLRSTGGTVAPFLTYGDYRWQPTDDRLEKAVRDLADPDTRAQLRGFTFGDEIKLADWFPKGEQADQLFRDAMVRIGESPAALTNPPRADSEWSDVRFDGSAIAAASNPRLFVRSRQFQEDFAIQQLTDASHRIRDAFGADPLVGATFSPHPSFRPDVGTFVRLFRSGAFNRATHDDYWWQASEMGPESTGFLIDAFRAGFPSGGGVIQPYVMPHSPGNTDRGFLLGVWSAISHGATALDLFRVGPEQLNTENYISVSDPARYALVRQAVYSLGPVEDMILDGKRRPTRVAILLADSTDRWEDVTPARGSEIPSDTKLVSQASTTERKGLWQALRHAHVPVDMLIEDDLESERIDQYSVIYLAGPQISAGAAAGLDRWVRSGGTLIGVAGAGSRDEFNQPLPTLDSVFGVQARSFDAAETLIRPRVEAPRLQVLDHITSDSEPQHMDAVAWKESIHPLGETEIAARFDDGSAAMTLHHVGAGRAVLVGTLPGVAYLRSGTHGMQPIPDRGPFMQTALTGFDPVIRGLISRWAEASASSWPRVSEPLVEASLIESADSILIPLANFGTPGTSVSVTIPNVGIVTRVWSVQNGDVGFQQMGPDVNLQISFDLVDFVVIERSTLG